MSDLHREQRPLLCDDCSEEEFDVKSYNYKRHNRPTIRSGRARNYAKGAALVLNRWPDNCTTSVAYWWLGVSMIAVTIFIIYNSVLIFGMIPPSNLKPPKYRTFNNDIKHTDQMLSTPEVFMHLIINNNSDAILDKYLPHASAMANKYPSFKYNFILILNDTLKDLRDFNDKEINEIAFNSLWENEKLNRKISRINNISVKHISLTEYMNDSPIRKFWRHLPPHLIEFLVRAISIWEKGGIAFNPKIMIPKLYKPNYIDKLYDIFNQYMNSNTGSIKRKIKAKIKTAVNTRPPNNIRDIINNLNQEDNNISNIDLSEAENNHMIVVSNTENNMKFKRDLKYISEIDKNIDGNVNENYKLDENNITSYEKNLRYVNLTDNTQVVGNILPLFLKYLFDDKPRKEVKGNNTSHEEISKNSTSSYNTFVNLNRNESRPVKKNSKVSKYQDEYGNTTSPKESNTEIPDQNFSVLKINTDNTTPMLSIDIKGNIIASKVACHAFLGTIFSNVVQHTEEETLSDFIISELSLFCKGLLSSCPGVNVILA